MGLEPSSGTVSWNRLPEPSEGEPSSTGGAELADCNVLDRDDLDDEEADVEVLSATTFHQTIQTDLEDLVAEIRDKANVTVIEEPNIDFTVRGPEAAEVRHYGKFMLKRNQSIYLCYRIRFIQHKKRLLKNYSKRSKIHSKIEVPYSRT